MNRIKKIKSSKSPWIQIEIESEFDETNSLNIKESQKNK